jgi:hypothetical protein
MFIKGDNNHCLNSISSFPLPQKTKLVMKKLAVLLVLSFNIHAFAQDFNFRIEIDSIQIQELGGLQSFAIGQHEGKWLVIGGRLDGLHRRQPWASFDLAGHNDQLFVIDPVTKKKWTASARVPDSLLAEQLRSTNMQFIQRGNHLFLTGGYGFSPTADDHITHPYLTVVDIPATIDAVINGKDVSNGFWRIKDDQFALCGGQMNFMDGGFCITGGHRFDGRYHPMNNSTFEQVYSSEVRRFQVDLSNRTVVHLPALKDGEVLRRRDFNVLPSIEPDGKEGLIAFSGVFQKEVDLPYLNAVRIHSEGVKEVPGFAQYYNHYHCANVSAYNSKDGSMHYLFFGGIAHYYDSTGLLVADNDVPFTPAISRVVKDAQGNFSEWRENISLPGYLGAASEFILDPTIKTFENEVIGLTELQGDRILIGYIYGGIQSSAANIFWINTGKESSATRTIYPVYLVKDEAGSGAKINAQSVSGLQLQILPDPLEKRITCWFNLTQNSDVYISMKDQSGAIVLQKKYKKLKPGSQQKTFKFKKLKRGDKYVISLKISGKSHEQFLVVN